VSLEASYLLQRIEAFKGIAILATKSKANRDEALLRRLRFVLDL
jgi:SpoVK/Ycf46/Vps4 family AAA+-type ATPase